MGRMVRLELCRRCDEAFGTLKKYPEILETSVSNLIFINKQTQGRWARVFLEEHIHTFQDLVSYHERRGTAWFFVLRGVGNKVVLALCEALETFILSVQNPCP